jgi:hypothetical protein
MGRRTACALFQITNLVISHIRRKDASRSFEECGQRERFASSACASIENASLGWRSHDLAAELARFVLSFEAAILECGEVKDVSKGRRDDSVVAVLCRLDFEAISPQLR